jgi:hypothetical protein
MTATRNEQATHSRYGANGADGAGPAALRNGARPALEGEIHDLVRRNVAPLKALERETATDPACAPVSDLTRRVSGTSLEEIDRVIRELNGIREMLRGEGERVTREIAGYASLNHAAITSMRVIADSLAEWKNGAQIHHVPR